MQIITKHGSKTTVGYFQAYSKGVYAIKLNGEVEVIDDYDNSAWYWLDTDNSLSEVIDVLVGTTSYLTTVSLNDCISLEKSFYYLDGILYIHYDDSESDIFIDRDKLRISVTVGGWANNYNKGTKNIYDGFYYKAIINSIDGLSKKIDPLKYGMLQFNQSNFSIINEGGDYDYLNDKEFIGSPIYFYLLNDNDAELTSDKIIFSGVIENYSNDKSALKFTVEDIRLFENVAICQNTVTVAEYPDCDKSSGKLKPVALGDIDGGFCQCVNVGALTNETSGTAQLLIHDTELGNITSVTGLFNKDGISKSYTVI